MTGSREESKMAKRIRDNFGEVDQSEFKNKRSPLNITDVRGANYKDAAIEWVSEHHD